MASPPTTPGPEIPECSEDWRFEETGAPCEWVEEYRPGGLHPVSLGDTFCEGKYKVIRKLGAGCSSTIWLVICEGYVHERPPASIPVTISIAHQHTSLLRSQLQNRPSRALSSQYWTTCLLQQMIILTQDTLLGFSIVSRTKVLMASISVWCSKSWVQQLLHLSKSYPRTSLGCL